MISRQLRRLSAMQTPAVRTLCPRSARSASTSAVPEMVVTEDPLQNGNYQNPPAVKRSLRDPYAGWWDVQERRNFGEPVHEDNDILGVFSTEPYTHFKPGFGVVLLGTFVASVGVLCGVVYQFYPDQPTVPRTFPGGLEAELGGKGAVPALSE